VKPYVKRQAIPKDIPFIYSCWLKSYKHDSEIGLSTTKTIFFDHYRLVLDHLLAKDSTKVYVACHAQEQDVIYGFLVAEPDKQILHYAFTKEAFWNLGIAKDLFQEAFPQKGSVHFTHRTKLSQILLRNHSELIYNPFLLFEGVTQGEISNE
jgi:hypothetical protein